MTIAGESILAAVLAIAGAVWGAASDRIATRWPDHEPGVEARGVDWRTIVCGLIGAVALAAVPLRFPDAPEVVVFLAWAAALVLLLATDLDQRLLPDVVTYPLAIGAIVVVFAGVDPFMTPADLPLAALVGVGVPVALYALSLPFGAGAFGLGDVKFLIGFGLLVGVERFVTGLIVGVLLAGVIIVALLVARRITLRSYVPYGPFLILGALWAVLRPA